MDNTQDIIIILGAVATIIAFLMGIPKVLKKLKKQAEIREHLYNFANEDDVLKSIKSYILYTMIKLLKVAIPSGIIVYVALIIYKLEYPSLLYILMYVVLLIALSFICAVSDLLKHVSTIIYSLQQDIKRGDNNYGKK